MTFVPSRRLFRSILAVAAVTVAAFSVLWWLTGIGAVSLTALSVLLAALAFSPSRRGALRGGAIVSGPVIILPIAALLDERLRYAELLSPQAILLETVASFTWAVAFSVSWGLLALLSARPRHQPYQWFVAPFCAWGLASIVSLWYYLFDGHLFDWPLQARSDILWAGVWSSILGFAAVALPVLPVAIRDSRHGARTAGVLPATIAVFIVITQWVLQLSLVWHTWLADH